MLEMEKLFLFLSLEGPNVGHQPGGLRWSSVQGTWSPQERFLPLNMLQLVGAAGGGGLPVRVQLDNAIALMYINHQGGTKSWAAQE